MIGLGRVEVTGGFLLLLAWLNYLDRSFLVPMAVLACGAHELGHLLAIRLLGGAVREIRLTAIGAELVLAGPLGYWQEGAAALAGPGVNLLLALLCCQFSWGLSFAGLNLVLALFNLPWRCWPGRGWPPGREAGWICCVPRRRWRRGWRWPQYGEM